MCLMYSMLYSTVEGRGSRHHQDGRHLQRLAQVPVRGVRLPHHLLEAQGLQQEARQIQCKP